MTFKKDDTFLKKNNIRKRMVEEEPKGRNFIEKIVDKNQYYIEKY